MSEKIYNLLVVVSKGHSSTGRASVSKTEGWGFEALCPCQLLIMSKIAEIFSKLSLPVSGVIALSSVIAFQAYGEESDLFRGLVLFVGITFSLIIALMSSSGRIFLVFFKDSIVEAKKVVWPTKKETIQTVLIVFAFVVVVSAFLWLADKFYEWFLYSIILGWK